MSSSSSSSPPLVLRLSDAWSTDSLMVSSWRTAASSRFSISDGDVAGEMSEGESAESSAIPSDEFWILGDQADLPVDDANAGSAVAKDGNDGGCWRPFVGRAL